LTFPAGDDLRVCTKWSIAVQQAISHFETLGTGQFDSIGQASEKVQERFDRLLKSPKLSVDFEL
jgi:hypothetical protein